MIFHEYNEITQNNRFLINFHGLFSLFQSAAAQRSVRPVHGTHWHQTVHTFHRKMFNAALIIIILLFIFFDKESLSTYAGWARECESMKTIEQQETSKEMRRKNQKRNTYAYSPYIHMHAATHNYSLFSWFVLNFMTIRDNYYFSCRMLN